MIFSLLTKTLLRTAFVFLVISSFICCMTTSKDFNGSSTVVDVVGVGVGVGSPKKGWFDVV